MNYLVSFDFRLPHESGLYADGFLHIPSSVQRPLPDLLWRLQPAVPISTEDVWLYVSSSSRILFWNCKVFCVHLKNAELFKNYFLEHSDFLIKWKYTLFKDISFPSFIENRSSIPRSQKQVLVTILGQMNPIHILTLFI